MENNLNIAFLQQDIIWEDTAANLAKLDVLLNNLKQGTDLVILPEMFHAGFTMEPEKIAESENGRVVKWMKEKASLMGAPVMGSVIIGENGSFYNRLFVVYHDGNYVTYDKRHLFSIGGENDNYRPGNKRVVVELKGWRILPLICYDLRFPVWSRNRNDYDLLVYVANWPASRRYVWKTLLKARALENQCYVIGVNRVGSDKETEYTGDSMVIDFKGKVMAEAAENEEQLLYAGLSLDKLNAFREKFPAWKDADDFEIKGIPE